MIAKFGTPNSYGNDAKNAFDCAVAINIKFENLKKKRANQCIIEYRIGIHYGTYEAGNMESKQRVALALIGNTVNVARRVLAKNLIQKNLITDELAQMMNYDLPSKEIPDYLIRGLNKRLELVKIFQL